MQRSWDVLYEVTNTTTAKSTNPAGTPARASRPRTNSRRLVLTLYDPLRFDEAAEVLEPTVAALREEFGISDRFTMNAQQGLGTVRLKQGRFDEAHAMTEEVLHAATERFGPDDARVISAIARAY